MEADHASAARLAAVYRETFPAGSTESNLGAAYQELLNALQPFADLLDRRWIDKAEMIALVQRGGHYSELKAIDLGDVLRARALLTAADCR